MKPRQRRPEWRKAQSASRYYGGDATIDFAEASLANVDLSGSELTASAGAFGDATIDFREANLTNVDLSGAKVPSSGTIIGI